MSSNSILLNAAVPPGPVRDKIIEVLHGEPSTSSVAWREGSRGHVLCLGKREITFVKRDVRRFTLHWTDDDGQEQDAEWTVIVTWEQTRGAEVVA